MIGSLSFCSITNEPETTPTDIGVNLISKINFCFGSKIEGKDFIFTSKSPNTETFVNNALSVSLVFIKVTCLEEDILYSVTFSKSISRIFDSIFPYSWFLQGFSSQ